VTPGKVSQLAEDAYVAMEMYTDFDLNMAASVRVWDNQGSP